jgi:serine/threonine protein kinase
LLGHRSRAYARERARRTPRNPRPRRLPPLNLSRALFRFKKANKYIKEDTVWAYLIQIAQGLQAMHSRNCLHRDVKAKNVFLTSKNHVRLGDLGCAKLLKAGLARTQIGT